ncbi:Selenoprotein Pb [Bagarius yarrelli]|uniref:Selenoprotein Pb n=1 Tax=Bagarius yarrelli TaxID=175774 RepID=A0A556U9C6_BAGYA|nr:Selenoprotein Pb [Bagarius yarrelli]
MRALLALCLASLQSLLPTSALFVERNSSQTTICKPAPHWEIDGRSPMNELGAARLGSLRDKLERGNLTDVEFLIVNEQDALSRAMYWELKRRTAVGIPVYQQSPLQDDVWDTLQGDKDDFLVYDRCGHLTFHIVLPYSFLHYPYVEAAVRATYFQNVCNCTLDSNSTQITSSNVTTERSTEPNKNVTESPSNKDHHHHHKHDQRHYHHQHQNQNHMKQNMTNPAITQTNSTTTVKQHTHHDVEHERLVITKHPS